MRTAPAELTWQMWTEVPTYSAIRMSRITMMSSEMVGIPGIPSSVEESPSFMRPPCRELQLLAVRDNGQLQGVGVLECPLHEPRVHDGPAVIGKARRARLLEIAELGEHLPLGALADGGNRVDVGEVGLPGLPQDELRHGAVVVHGVRVGHAGNGGETARHGRLASRLDRFLVLVARLPQVRVDVDEPGHDELSLEIQDRESRVLFLALSVVDEVAAHRGDLAAFDEDVQDVVDLLGGVDDPSAFEQHRHDLPPDKR